MGAVRAKRMFSDAYRGKRVLVTGHTGFKGSWLSLWLAQLGAEVTGFSLAPLTTPDLFGAAGIAQDLTDLRGDIRDQAALGESLATARPDFVFHLAAQPLVLESYADPAGTFATNVTGSINLLEALRAAKRAANVVMVTTDKVYRNLESGAAFAEDDPLGGHDPYSASKAAMEIAVASWRASFFGTGPRVATARAGNVIGGGDWSANRIVPDLVRAVAAGEVPALRNPAALRPWQHVLEPLAGYLWLGAKLAESDRFAEGWNFGPDPADTRSVGELATALLAHWGKPAASERARSDAPHEAGLLRLSIAKAQVELGWEPVWDFATTVERTAHWYQAVATGEQSARAACLADLEQWCAAATARGLSFTA
jgi:CDP-glucose 4,6-dehydratase